MQDDFFLDLSASCTKDQAVLRLLGWRLDTIYPNYIRVDESGAIKDGKDGKDGSMQAYRASQTLEEYLIDIYRSALQRYEDAVPDNPTDDQLEVAMTSTWPEIERAEATIEKARGYLIDIVDELAKGDCSQLRLDRELTNGTGVQHVTIKSLNKWFSTDYKTPASPAEGVATGGKLDWVDMGQANKHVSEMSKPERSLYVTLALLAEAYAKEVGPEYMDKDGKINVLKVSEAVSQWGATHMQDAQSFPDQSASSIKIKLTAASNCKVAVLGRKPKP